MNLCYRSIHYQGNSFALYLPKSKHDAKFRGVSYRMPPAVKMSTLSVTELKYRGVSYPKKMLGPIPNLAFYNGSSEYLAN